MDPREDLDDAVNEDSTEDPEGYPVQVPSEDPDEYPISLSMTKRLQVLMMLMIMTK